MMLPIDYGPEPAFAVCADSRLGIERWAAAASALGARMLPPSDIDGALAMLDTIAEPDMVLVDIGTDAPGPLDALLDRLDMAAAQGVHASIVALAPALIDVVTARITHPDVVLLCDPTPIDRAAAIGLAAARPPKPYFRERGEESPMQLRRLSEDGGRIARALAESSGTQAVVDVTPPLGRVANAPADMPSVGVIRATIRARRIREQFFAADLFADPAWDMLLDLLLARLEQRTVAVSSLCIAASVPPTTALRWIKRLTDEGLFLRTADPRDGRRVFIDLAPEAVGAMAAYFGAIERAGITFSDR